MLRITRLWEGTSKLTLLLEGHIRHQWLQELEQQVTQCRSLCEVVILDLAGVNFVSADGLNLLRRLRTEGVSFANCPAILGDLME